MADGDPPSGQGPVRFEKVTVNGRTELRINGKAYRSLSEVPPEYRPYFIDRNHNGIPDFLESATEETGGKPLHCERVTRNGRTRFRVNGKEYASLGEVPEAARRIFLQMDRMAAGEGLGGALDVPFRATGERPDGPPAPAPLPPKGGGRRPVPPLPPRAERPRRPAPPPAAAPVAAAPSGSVFYDARTERREGRGSGLQLLAVAGALLGLALLAYALFRAFASKPPAP